MQLDQHGMVTLSRASLAALRTALLRDAGPGGVAYLQEAGFAGGEALYASFQRWLADHHAGSLESLDIEGFRQRAIEYFHACGWGTLEISTMGSALVALDSADWAESDPHAALPHPGCYLTSGLLADFFTRLAGSPLATMEVECRSMGHAHCRWLLGGTDALQAVYTAMTEGTPYHEAAEKLA
jgi:predicted hydrocarbon binding protein